MERLKRLTIMHFFVAGMLIAAALYAYKTDWFAAMQAALYAVMGMSIIDLVKENKALKEDNAHMARSLLHLNQQMWTRN